MSATCQCDGYAMSLGAQHDQSCPAWQEIEQARRAERPPLPEQPLATVNLNSTLRGALAGRGDARSRLAAAAMVAIGLELEARGYELDHAWCTNIYLQLHPPIDRAWNTAPPKRSRGHRAATS